MKAPCRRTPRTTRWIRRNAVDLWQEVSGATSIEYGLIASLIALAIIGALVLVRESLLDLPFQLLIDAITGVLP